MKKLLLATAVGVPLLAASCSTTEYYKDDLAVARRLDEDPEDRQRQQAARTAERPRTEALDRAGPIEQPTLAREDFERQRDLGEVEAQLDDMDQRISDVEATLEDMPEAERERATRDVRELRDRQRRADALLRDAETEETALGFNEARDELRDAVRELEEAWYGLMVAGDPGDENL